jgi:hypothetical protein
MSKKCGGEKRVISAQEFKQAKELRHGDSAFFGVLVSFATAAIS